MEKRKEILPIVKTRAHQFRLDWRLLDGIICAESAYNQWAVRYERKSKIFSFPDKFSKINRVSLESEIQQQKFSYGLSQLMGYNIRHLGYNGPLMLLCSDVEKNIYYMCRFVENLMIKNKFQDDLISVYNFGHIAKRDGKYINQLYVDKVLSFIDLYQIKSP